MRGVSTAQRGSRRPGGCDAKPLAWSVCPHGRCRRSVQRNVHVDAAYPFFPKTSVLERPPELQQQTDARLASQRHQRRHKARQLDGLRRQWVWCIYWGISQWEYAEF